MPKGSRADVVCAERGDLLPTPVAVVRLLVTAGSSLLVVPRPRGPGVDIPTRTVGDAAVHDCVQRLSRDTVGRDEDVPALAGWVRNHVPEVDDVYPWPAPDAYFTVWRIDLPASRREAATRADSTWLKFGDAPAALVERHWWPLAAAVIEG